MKKSKNSHGLPPLASRILRPLAVGMFLISALLTALAAAMAWPAAQAAGQSLSASARIFRECIV